MKRRKLLASPALKSDARHGRAAGLCRRGIPLVRCGHGNGECERHAPLEFGRSERDMLQYGDCGIVRPARRGRTAIAVNVRLGNGSVAVPVLLKQTQAAGTELFLSGSGVEPVGIADEAGVSAGLVVAARIHVSGGELTDAVFDEATLIGSPARPLGRMACALERTEPAIPHAVSPHTLSS